MWWVHDELPGELVETTGLLSLTDLLGRGSEEL